MPVIILYIYTKLITKHNVLKSKREGTLKRKDRKQGSRLITPT